MFALGLRPVTQLRSCTSLSRGVYQGRQRSIWRGTAAAGDCPAVSGQSGSIALHARLRRALQGAVQEHQATCAALCVANTGNIKCSVRLKGCEHDHRDGRPGGVLLGVSACPVFAVTVWMMGSECLLKVRQAWLNASCL